MGHYRSEEERQALVRAGKAFLDEYLLLSDGEKLMEIDYFFSFAYGAANFGSVDLLANNVCDLFVARTLRLLLNEVRALREDVQKRRDQTNPPHQPQLESSLLLEEVRNLRQDIGHVGQSVWLKELKELRQGLIPLQRANHFMYVSYACLGVLVLLLFK